MKVQSWTLCVGWLRNIIASFWNANQSSQEPSDNALWDADRLCRLSACFLQHPSSLWKTRWYTVISTYFPFRCLLSLPTFRRPLSLVVVHSSLCDGIIPQITIHTQPAGNSVCIVRITILWSLTDWKLYLLTVVSPHFLLGLEKEGLCEYNVQNFCCLYVGFIFLSYRYQGAVYQLRFAPHRVPEEHGAVFLELRSGLRLWLKFCFLFRLVVGLLKHQYLTFIYLASLWARSSQIHNGRTYLEE